MDERRQGGYQPEVHAMNRMPEAVHALTEAIRLNPGHVDARNNLGTALRAMGRFDEAAVEFRQAIAIRPDYRLAHVNLAELLFAECRYALASGLVLAGQVDEAMPEALAAIRLKPELEEAHTGYLLGLHYRLHPADEVLQAHREWARTRSICRKSYAARCRCKRRSKQRGTVASAPQRSESGASSLPPRPDRRIARRM